jgi:methylated-DNA-[protein]-cysteine S-methyltransferase
MPEADQRLFLDHLKTPVGSLRLLVTAAGAVRQLGWFDGDDLPAGVELVAERDPFGVSSKLQEYFAGRVEAIDRLPVDARGTTFRQRVWKALREIPAGSTASYADIARRIGNPSSTRAVGGANHVNPICIVVPCHRVIGKDGSLTGYAGGLERKRWLLSHEARYASARARREPAHSVAQR